MMHTGRRVDDIHVHAQVRLAFYLGADIGWQVPAIAPGLGPDVA